MWRAAASGLRLLHRHAPMLEIAAPVWKRGSPISKVEMFLSFQLGDSHDGYNLVSLALARLHTDNGHSK